MKSNKAAKKKNTTTPTQHHLLISEIKQDTVVMKDGTLRATLMVSSINFALKNDDEQNAIVSAYVSFLNSIDHPLQIVIQSRKLEIKSYLDKLLEQERNQQNELLRTQIADYRSFVTQLVDLGEIMSKKFYVVVPYDPRSNKNKSFWMRFKEVVNPVKAIRLKGERFDDRKHELDQRVRQIEAGLTSMGLSVVRLDTQSLIELYYSTYNTDISLSEPLPTLDQIDVEDM